MRSATIFKYLAAGLIFLISGESLAIEPTTTRSDDLTITKGEGKRSDVFVMTNDYKVGLANQFIIAIKIEDGFKFNDEYPSTVRILRKPKLIKTFGVYEKEHFLKERDYVLVLIPFTPLKEGFEFIKINMRYSVCNETSCIIENFNHFVELDINE